MCYLCQTIPMRDLDYMRDAQYTLFVLNRWMDGRFNVVFAAPSQGSLSLAWVPIAKMRTHL